MLGWSIEVHTLAQQPSPSYLGRDGTALWLLKNKLKSREVTEKKSASCCGGCVMQVGRRFKGWEGKNDRHVGKEMGASLHIKDAIYDILLLEDNSEHFTLQVVRKIFCSVARRPKYLIKVKHLISSIQYHGSPHWRRDGSWSQLKLTSRSGISAFTVDIMTTEGTRLCRTSFSRLCSSINKQSSAKFLQSAQKCYSRYRFLCQSPGNLAASCSLLLSSRSKIPDKSHFLWYPLKLPLLFLSRWLIFQGFPLKRLPTPWHDNMVSGPQTSITFHQPEHYPWSDADGFFLVSTKLCFQPSIEVYVWPGINDLTSHNVVTVIGFVLDGIDYLTVTVSSSTLTKVLDFIPSCVWSAAQELKCMHHS